MKLQALVLLQSLASVCLAQCTVELKPTHPKFLVCGLRGHTKRDEQQRYLQFTAPNRNACTLSCFRDPTCLTDSYDGSDGTCTFFLNRIRQQSFKKDNSSSLVFHNKKCFQWTSECLTALNPSFEAAIGHPVAAKQYRPQSLEVTILPWAIHNPFGVNTFAYLATPDTMPAGSQAAPSGNNFAVMSVAPNDEPKFLQTFSLQPSTTYTISAWYSYIKYDGESTDNTDDDFNMYLSCQTTDGELLNTPFIDLDSSTGSVNGDWIQASNDFTTTEDPAISQAQCGVLFEPPSVDFNRAVFGLDGFKIVRTEMR